MTHGAFRYLLFAALAGMAFDVHAARRTIRIDGFGDTWVEHAIGTSGCPGTTDGVTPGDTLVHLFGFTFSGRAKTTFLFDTYCQTAQPGTLTETGYTYGDEQVLATLFGNNPNAVHGIRYSFLDADRFSGDATGFQWAVYTFPGGLNVVTLYGLEATVLDATSYILGPIAVWTGSNGYDGGYFCFRGTQYVGPWNGSLSDTSSACLQALQADDSIFFDGFDGSPGAQDVGADDDGIGELPGSPPPPA